jgi:hypothetical protein
MSQIAESTIPALIDKNYQRLLDDWVACQKREGALRSGQIKEAELADQSRRFLSELGKGAGAGRLDDTLVAQYLIKTVSAARLMGADCIISGIRPQIAQTIVR